MGSKAKISPQNTATASEMLAEKKSVFGMLDTNSAPSVASKKTPLKKRKKAKKGIFQHSLVLSLTVLSALSAIATYIALTKWDAPMGAPPKLIMSLIGLNAVLLLALCAVVGKQLYGILTAFRGVKRSRLQRNLVGSFATLALVPGIIVSVFAGYLFYYGTQTWVDKKLRTALEESVAVAEAYLNEHRQSLTAEAAAMALDINNQSSILESNYTIFGQFLSKQAAIRGLTEAIVFQPGRMLARSNYSFGFAMDSVTTAALQQADASGSVVLLSSEGTDHEVQALVKLDSIFNGYLLIGRLVDPEVLIHMERTSGAVSEYRQLTQRLGDLQWQFITVFALVSLLLLLAALWFGLSFAARLLKPINALYLAADRVRAGDLTARVAESNSQDELAEMGRAFNRMAAQLQSQREALMEANRQLDARRRFSEAVLSGVSAGVIALDKTQYITLCNRSAVQLLGLDPAQLASQHLSQLVPAMTALLNQSVEKPGDRIENDVTLTVGDKPLTLHVRITKEMVGEEVEGYVVTFDDITKLVTAQRRAAWADVARRIAHEIKNPLTPIQLSAERLKRKYGKNLLGEERENFDKYANTIIRHVGDIGSMVEEFANFARMPAPIHQPVDMGNLAVQTVFSEQNRSQEVEFRTQIPNAPVILHCDAGQIGRAMMNVLKNAAEAFQEEEGAPNRRHVGPPRKPVVLVRLEPTAMGARIIIEDNGAGFPRELMGQLTEPYVTTRPKGTGLGLAIVRKILEDHKGELHLENRREGGARVIMDIPDYQSAAAVKPRQVDKPTQEEPSAEVTTQAQEPETQKLEDA